MTNDVFELHCPKCGERATHTSTDLNLENPYTCTKCGGITPYGELKSPTGKTVMEHFADRARDALKGIKGFKPGG